MKDADDLMVVLPVADTEGGSGVKKVVVLTPREAAQVRVGAHTYPVEGRIAVLEDSRLGTSDRAVAVDGTGRTLGTARLPVASPIDGLFVPR